MCPPSRILCSKLWTPQSRSACCPRRSCTPSVPGRCSKAWHGAGKRKRCANWLIFRIFQWSFPQKFRPICTIISRWAVLPLKRASAGNSIGHLCSAWSVVWELLAILFYFRKYSYFLLAWSNGRCTRESDCNPSASWSPGLFWSPTIFSECWSAKSRRKHSRKWNSRLLSNQPLLPQLKRPPSRPRQSLWKTRSRKPTQKWKCCLCKYVRL